MNPGMVTHAFQASPLEAEGGEYLSLRSAWSTQLQYSQDYINRPLLGSREQWYQKLNCPQLSQWGFFVWGLCAAQSQTQSSAQARLCPTYATSLTHSRCLQIT